MCNLNSGNLFKTVNRLSNNAMLHNLNKHYPDKPECQLSSYPSSISARKFWDGNIYVTPQSSCIRKYCTFVYLCLALDTSASQKEDIQIFTLLGIEIPCVGGGQCVDV